MQGGLPGQIHPLDRKAICDTEGHEDRPAVMVVQGETDSFGAEYHYVCEACLEEARKNRYWFIGTCPNCGANNCEQYPYRDSEEGSSGPVYHACEDCRTKIMREMREILEREYFD